VRNFQELLGKCGGSRIAWAGYNFSTQGISQPPSEEVANQCHASTLNYRKVP
jgi:hypothetical protein